MAMKTTVNGRIDSVTPANISERCALCIIGVLGGFVALVQGMVAAQALSAATLPGDVVTYFAIAVCGIWAPAIGIFGSIVGVMIRSVASMPMLILSPLASVGGYFFYTYFPISTLVQP